MISSNSFRHLAAYGVSLPTFAAVPPKLAKETVYMPSRLAAQLLGKAGEPKVEPQTEAPKREA